MPRPFARLVASLVVAVSASGPGRAILRRVVARRLARSR